MEIITKTCSKCQEAKELTMFSINRATKDGRCRRCKKCVSEYKKSRRKLDRELTAEKMADPEYRAQIRARDRKWRRANPQLHLYRAAKSRSKRKGIEFDIELSDVIIPKRCPLLDCEFIPGTKDNYKYSYSLDRIDSTKGYVKGNVWVISSIANTMKNDATLEELKVFAKNILQKL